MLIQENEKPKIRSEPMRTIRRERCSILIRPYRFDKVFFVKNQPNSI